MLRTLLLGLRLRCPNCEKGRISDGLFHIHETCPVCQVRFERKDGESAGASIMTLSLLPIPALIVSFVLMALNPELPLLVVVGIPALLIVLTSILGYRHARGFWIGIVAVTDGLYPDTESEAS